MRPTSLRLNNIGCYRGSHHIDLDQDQQLFGIVGKTGSGKSLILDSITFALYGQTARLGKRGSAALLTSPGTEHMAVELEFTTAGNRYLVLRSYGGKSEMQVSRWTGDEWRRVKETDKISEAEAFVEKVVGLDYDSFVRAVILPQGAFDEFLKGDAAKRHEVLTRLLGTETIEQMRARASAEAKELKSRISYIDEDLEQNYQGATKEEQGEQKEQIKEIQADIWEGEEAIRELEEQGQEFVELAQLDRKRTEAQHDLDELSRKQESIDTSSDTLRWADIAETLRSQYQRVVEAESNYQDAERESSQLEEEQGDLDLDTENAQDILFRAQDKLEKRGAIVLSDLELLNSFTEKIERIRSTDGLARSLGRAEKRVTSLQGKVEQTAEDITETRSAVKDAEVWVAETDRNLKAARSAYDNALIENAASSLRVHLHEGESCPVCEQTVDEIPEALGHFDIEEFQEEVDRSVQEHEAASRREVGAKGRLEALGEQQEQVYEELGEAQAEHQGILEELADTLAEFDVDHSNLLQDREAILDRLIDDAFTYGGGHPPEVITKLETEWEKLQQAVVDARERHQKLINRSEVVDARLEPARKAERIAYSNFKAEKARLDAQVEEVEFPGEDLDDLESYLLDEAQRKTLSEQVERHQKRVEDAERRLSEANFGLGERCYYPDSHRQHNNDLLAEKHLHAEAVERLGQAKSELTQLERLIEKATKLRDERGKLEERHSRYAVLATELRRDKFQAYLLAHAQADLAAQASVTIGQITAERYRLNYHDNEYFVTDTWFDDYERSVKTLSGGETFIVSLALALALSDVIAGSNRLEALFLDEGFGTLDPTMLDSVSEALMRLSAEGRMVGVITHVEALTDRLPLRLRVDKSEGGSTVRWEG